MKRRADKELSEATIKRLRSDFLDGVHVRDLAARIGRSEHTVLKLVEDLKKARPTRRLDFSNTRGEMKRRIKEVRRQGQLERIAATETGPLR